MKVTEECVMCTEEPILVKKKKKKKKKKKNYKSDKHGLTTTNQI